MKHKSLKKISKSAMVAGCAVIILAVCIGIVIIKKKGNLSGLFNHWDPTNVNSIISASGIVTVEAAAPEPTAANLSAQRFREGDEHWNWWNSYRELVSESEAVRSGMDGYYISLMEKLLSGKDENTVCSPLNTYIAFAMLAEVSDGNTRQQILDMLGAADIEILRSNIQSLWNCNYVDTPILKSKLANSLWLRDNFTYNDDTLNVLAQQYHASSFIGVPGSEKMDKALQMWTDKNTGGLLSDYTKDMSLDTDTVLTLVSTIYYRAMWTNEFNERGTTKEAFHGTKNDAMVDMMHKTDTMPVYSTDTFTALGIGLNDSGAMYFYLPEEGVDVDLLASDPDILKATGYGQDDHWSHPLVNLSVPKFKVQGKIDLLDTLPKLGVTDALDPEISDFSVLTDVMDELYLDKAEHAAMVEIDEYGVTGAAYTEMDVNAGSALPQEQIDFVIDRPFMFMITGMDGSILFSGIIKNVD